MKKYYFAMVCFAVLSVALVFGFRSSAQNESKDSANHEFVSPHIVISQFQVAGGSATDEFVELHNTSSNPVDLNGYRVVYRSAAGVNDVAMVEWTTSTIVPAGGFYLIATSTYDGPVPSNVNYNTATVSMSATGGGIAVRSGALNSGVVIDSVGYGTATNIFVEGVVTTAPPANDSRIRNSNSCQDTDSNVNDFGAQTPAAPRNASSAPVTCGGGGGTQILASGAANPTTVAPGAATLLTVSVFPATTPPSTGITVTANLTSIGGSATQQFFDNGTNGDVTSGDNVFSFSATVGAATPGGPTSIPAVAADAETRTANVSINLTISAPIVDDPLLLGNPSNATTNTANENNYLMIKPQYALSYNRSTATPNWVAWRLDSTWIGTAPRQDDYRGDTSLPSGWYQVQDNDYSGSGYDRGHMCPSGDRTRSIPDNSATFLMTNFVPQLGANNQGPWNDFENYCRSLANSGNEVYIFTGPVGNIGTIASGRIVVPQYTWKVVMVMTNGSDDLGRVTRATRAFGIVVPNFAPISSNQWRNYRVTVDAVEALTGLNFFSNVPKNTQELIEKRRDRL